MTTSLQDSPPIPRPDEKPSNGGRFSDDRRYWKEVHKRRYLQWQGGDGIEQIAASEGVTYNAVKHSLLWCEAAVVSCRCVGCPPDSFTTRSVRTSVKPLSG